MFYNVGEFLESGLESIANISRCVPKCIYHQRRSNWSGGFSSGCNEAEKKICKFRDREKDVFDRIMSYCQITVIKYIFFSYFHLSKLSFAQQVVHNSTLRCGSFHYYHFENGFVPTNKYFFFKSLNFYDGRTRKEKLDKCCFHFVWNLFKWMFRMHM